MITSESTEGPAPRVRGEEFLVERGEAGVGGGGELAPDAAAEHRADVGQVDDQTGEASRVQPQADQVHRRAEQLRVDLGEERVHGAVGHQDVPVAVEDQRRVRLVRAEHASDRVAAAESAPPSSGRSV